MALDPQLLALFAEIRGGMLITIERDGRPQSSVVTHAFDPATRTLRVSVTDDHAKIRNLRLTYQLTRTGLSAYAVGEATAVFTPVVADPQDATVDALVALYRDVQGEHPDREEFRTAMVDDGRVLLTATFDHVYGWARP